MLKTRIFFLSFLLTFLYLVSGCDNTHEKVEIKEKYSIKDYAKNVAKHYGDPNFSIIKGYKTTTDNDGQPMHIVKIKGDFSRNGIKANFITFSCLIEKYKVWAIIGSKTEDTQDEVWKDNKLNN